MQLKLLLIVAICHNTIARINFFIKTILQLHETFFFENLLVERLRVRSGAGGLWFKSWACQIRHSVAYLQNFAVVF